MITVNLKGVQGAMNATIGRVNARAGQAEEFKDGIFKVCVDALALMYAACELLLSIAVDVRRLADAADEPATTPTNPI